MFDLQTRYSTDPLIGINHLLRANQSTTTDDRSKTQMNGPVLGTIDLILCPVTVKFTADDGFQKFPNKLLK
jgi:hypothetical protein